MKAGRSLQEMAAEIERRHREKEDFLLPPQQIEIQANASTVSMRLYDTSLDMAEVNKALVMQEVSVISSGLCNDTLEDYFKKITGGEGIA